MEILQHGRTFFYLFFSIIVSGLSIWWLGSCLATAGRMWQEQVEARGQIELVRSPGLLVTCCRRRLRNPFAHGRRGAAPSRNPGESRSWRHSTTHPTSFARKGRSSSCCRRTWRQTVWFDSSLQGKWEIFDSVILFLLGVRWSLRFARGQISHCSLCRPVRWGRSTRLLAGDNRERGIFFCFGQIPINFQGSTAKRDANSNTVGRFTKQNSRIGSKISLLGAISPNCIYHRVPREGILPHWANRRALGSRHPSQNWYTAYWYPRHLRPGNFDLMLLNVIFMLRFTKTATNSGQLLVDPFT